MAGGIAAASGPLPARPGGRRRRRRRSRTPSCGAATDGIGRGLRGPGVGPGSTVGILARNGRGFVISVVAAAKVGADVVYLNTGFAGPQLADVVAHEGIDTILHDDVFADIVAEPRRRRDASSGSELRALGRGPRRWCRSRRRAASGRQVILDVGHDRAPEGRARAAASAASTR